MVEWEQEGQEIKRKKKARGREKEGRRVKR